MLDERTQALLAGIADLCKGDGFHIIEERELKNLAPFEEGEIGRIISRLAEKEFIELRYAEEGTYCVRALPAGKSYTERARQEASERSRTRREVLFFAAAGAFLGSTLSALFVFLVGLLRYV